MSRICLLGLGDETQLKTFLQPYIASSMFLLSNLAKGGIVDEGKPYQATYLGVFEEDRLVSVASHTWQGMILLQTPVKAPELLEAMVKQTQRPVTGIAGPSFQVKQVCNTFAIHPQLCHYASDELLFRLQLKSLEALPRVTQRQCQLRLATNQDQALVSQWRKEFCLELQGDHLTPKLEEKVAQEVTNLLKQKAIYLLFQKDIPVAMTLVNARFSQIVQLGGIYTPPQYRDRGFGRLIVKATLLAMKDQGVQEAVLYTGKNNFPAQRIYQALGFQEIGKYGLLLFSNPLDLSYF
jgi:predicted GNAT family acetyltransferase